MANEARLKIELTEGHRIRPRFSGKLGIHLGDVNMCASMFLGAGPSCG